MRYFIIMVSACIAVSSTNSQQVHIAMEFICHDGRYVAKKEIQEYVMKKFQGAITDTSHIMIDNIIELSEQDFKDYLRDV